MISTIPKELLQFGTREIEKPIARLILAVDGVEKTGKSHFACSAPSPIVYLNADKSSEDVAYKFTQQGKVIYEIPLRKTYKFSATYTRELAMELMTNFNRAYKAALELPGVRTIVIDTASEVYDWYTTALLPVGAVPSDYGKYVYPAWVRTVFEAYDHDKNIIWLHKLKDEVENTTGGPYGSKRTGFKKRAGYRDMTYSVQGNILLDRLYIKDGTNPGPFIARICNSSHNPDAAGEEFKDSDISFQAIANTLMDEDHRAWLCTGKECKRCYPPKREKKVSE